MISFCPKQYHHKNHKDAVKDLRAFTFLLKKKIGEFCEIKYDFYNITKIILKPFTPFILTIEGLRIKSHFLSNGAEFILFANYVVKIKTFEKQETENFKLVFIDLLLCPEPMLRSFIENDFIEVKIQNSIAKLPEKEYSKKTLKKYNIEICENNKVLVSIKN